MTDVETVHPNIVQCWQECEIDGRDFRQILVVETDAEMKPGCDGYDPEIIEEVRRAAIKLLRATPNAIDLVRIVPIRT